MARSKWEYKVLNIQSRNYQLPVSYEDELNRLGAEGWELVGIASINFKTGATDHISLVFKRERQAPQF